MESSKDLQKEFALAVGIKGSISTPAFSGAFSAGVDSVERADRTGSQKLKFVRVERKCIAYEATLDDHYNVVEKPFKEYVRKMRKELDEKNVISNDTIYQFVQKYGTHYVKTVQMGSKFGQVITVDVNNKEEENQSSRSYKVNAQAEGKTMLVKAEASANVDSKKAEKSAGTFEKYVRDTNNYTRGSMPPKDVDAGVWVDSKPKLDSVKEELEPIWEVITPRNILGTKSINDPDKKKAIKKVRKAVQQYLESGVHCQRLVKEGLLKTCDLDPKVIETCRVCKTCGGEHGFQAGVYNEMRSKDGLFKVTSFDEECGGELNERQIILPQKQCTKEEIDRDECFPQLSLCCMESHKCRVCTSCGRAFEEHAGTFQELSMYDEWLTSIKGSYAECGANPPNNVHGQLLQMLTNGEKPQLCCQSKNEESPGAHCKVVYEHTAVAPMYKKVSGPMIFLDSETREIHCPLVPGG